MTAKREVTRSAKEQGVLLDLFESATHRFGYYEIFQSLLDYGISEYCPTTDFHFPTNFTEKEIDLLKSMLQEVIKLCRQRCNLWTGDKSNTGWYDAFGTLYESIASSGAKSQLGQFFTPDNIVNMMCIMTVPTPDVKQGGTMGEPACGSGRFILATTAINPYLYCVGNDLDQICAKMTALNMCLNGCIGEITCCDGLYPTESAYRFGYRVLPLMATMPESQARILNLLPNERKQFVLLPMTHEQSFYCSPFSDANLARKKEAIKAFEPQAVVIQQHKEHREAIHAEGFKGVLFEVEQVVREKKEKRQQKPVSTAKVGSIELSLF